jgi:hypothetical protein
VPPLQFGHLRLIRRNEGRAETSHTIRPIYDPIIYDRLDEPTRGMLETIWQSRAGNGICSHRAWRPFRRPWCPVRSGEDLIAHHVI